MQESILDQQKTSRGIMQRKCPFEGSPKRTCQNNRPIILHQPGLSAHVRLCGCLDIRDTNHLQHWRWFEFVGNPTILDPPKMLRHAHLLRDVKLRHHLRVRCHHLFLPLFSSGQVTFIAHYPHIDIRITGINYGLAGDFSPPI